MTPFMHSTKGGSISLMISSLLQQLLTRVVSGWVAPASTTPDVTSSEPRSIRALMQGEPFDDYEFLGPLRSCLCGSELFIAIVGFDEDGAIGTYFTDGRCAVCHADVRLITEVDVSA